MVPWLLLACVTEGSVPAIDPSAIELPEGSGDYRATLALASSYHAGAIGYDELERALLARQLPAHPLGDGYLMIPVPAPPPGRSFDPRSMPADWERTWGEVAMAFWLGALTREEYDRLHRAAHPGCR